MLMKTYTQPSVNDNVAAAVQNHTGWEAPAKMTADSTPAAASATTSAAGAPKNLDSTLLNVLYERIVRLEQQHHEKDAQIARLTQAMTRLSAATIPSAPAVTAAAAIDPRYSGGVLVWRISPFAQMSAAMRDDPNRMYYSPDAYTAPHGYRYCVRINCSPRAASSDCLGLHVHLMQSPNDLHLDWPFRGRIKISMVHPVRSQRTKNDIIMSKPEIMAFQRPEQDISPRGFGFLEWASVQQVQHDGFVVDDTLMVKVQVTIV